MSSSGFGVGQRVLRSHQGGSPRRHTRGFKSTDDQESKLPGGRHGGRCPTSSPIAWTDDTLMAPSQPPNFTVRSRPHGGPVSIRRCGEPHCPLSLRHWPTVHVSQAPRQESDVSTQEAASTAQDRAAEVVTIGEAGQKVTRFLNGPPKPHCSECPNFAVSVSKPPNTSGRPVSPRPCSSEAGQPRPGLSQQSCDSPPERQCHRCARPGHGAPRPRRVRMARVQGCWQRPFPRGNMSLSWRPWRSRTDSFLLHRLPGRNHCFTMFELF